MDLTDPVHPDCAPSMSYQIPVSAPLRQIQYLPAYMHVPARDRTSTGQGPGHLMNFSSPPIPSQIHNSSTVPLLQSFSSLHMIPQSASETWHHRVSTNHYTTSCPLPPAPTNSINNFMNNTYTPIVSPPIPLFNYLQSPVLVPPALTCTPSRMGSPHLIDHVPSRIVHQPRPHQIVDLDRISLVSINFHNDLHSAPAIMADFPRDNYRMTQSRPPTIRPVLQWFPGPMHPPTEQQYPLYYANPPYSFPYTLPPESSHSDTPCFEIEYSSIHSTFLATIKDLDSLKDRKSWVK
ncbi:hypothetical protein F5876DRAFT_84361 [Lentinula aff. lateritia]|uniref:Uncharacterized protein n=1 Tax=Lentinula aff. lateritia TaxID=2804960 RepID=A0ACC1TGD5_9AGAR|nr:hypothetical protein F5876DRAFT_84361 [Lentinula aff. lateritia]